MTVELTGLTNLQVTASLINSLRNWLFFPVHTNGGKKIEIFTTKPDGKETKRIPYKWSKAWINKSGWCFMITIDSRLFSSQEKGIPMFSNFHNLITKNTFIRLQRATKYLIAHLSFSDRKFAPCSHCKLLSNLLLLVAVNFLLIIHKNPQKCCFRTIEKSH